MKILSPLLAAALAVGMASAQDCSTYQQSINTMDMTLWFVADVANGILRGQLTYTGEGWLGFAVSADGLMEGSSAVLGLADDQPDAGVNRYLLAGYFANFAGGDAPEGVEESFVQDGTQSVLTFAVPLRNSDNPNSNVYTDGGSTYFLLAAGSSNVLGYHAVREPVEVIVEPCLAGDTTTPEEEAGTDPEAEGNIFDSSAFMVGDSIQHEGYVLDRYCIDQGVFLDQPDLASLENPFAHTVHCLIDADPCINSEFELLADPVDGETTWTRAFVLDQASKDLVVELAKSLGGPSCTNCNGEGHLRAGLRVQVEGSVTAMADAATGVPATVSLTSVEPVFPFTGQAIELEGYISDQFCLQAGSFLDNGLPSLEMPERHTVHCLIDPDVCVNSPFEVLLDPEEGETMYGRGYTLDADSKEQAIALAMEVGVCDKCSGEGTIVEGFRAMLDAIIVDDTRNLESGAGPIISVSSLEAVYPAEDYTIGQMITVEGYVTDRFCIDRGTFLDTGLSTMEFTDRHTLHCLLDPPFCLETPFEIMVDPDYAAGETMWSRGFVLDDASKEQVIALGREIGNCDTCSGGETGQVAGFRVRLEAEVVELADPESGAGPLISVSNVESVGQYSVGQTIQVEGFVVDTFCIDQGVYLDTGLPTLAHGDEHTLHCLIDAPPCKVSSYEILLDPESEGGNWTRGFTLDDASKDTIVALAKQVGGPSCTDCDGTGTLEKGFRVHVTATVVDNTRNVTSGMGPIIAVTDAVWVEPPEVTYQVGDEITVEGYVTDQFCIERGSFLDTGLSTFENTDRHTLHCLLDPPLCLETPFEILIDPDFAAGETMWSRGFVLDDASKEQVIALGREVGNCDTCSGGETGQVAGFRVRLTAEIVELADPESGAGPLISVSSLESVGQYSIGQTIQVEGYVVDTFCIEQGVFLDTGLPTLAHGNEHTLHCLIDAPPCKASAYEILYDPITEGGNWTRAFTLDQESKATVTALAKQVGGPSCTECDGTGDLEAGFRVRITATIVDNERNSTTGSGPLISILDVEPVLPVETSEACELDAVSQTFSEVPITFTYELGVDEATGMGTFSAVVEYEGQGWVGFGISPDGKMVGSLGIIGLPDADAGESNPGKYDLGGFAPAQVVLTDQQTLLAGDIVQNETHTTLSFTKFLTEPDELAINPSGENHFLVAAGSSNALAYHAVRHPFTATLACPSEGDDDGGLNVAVGDVLSVEGFVMDNFCIERGTLLDAPSIVTLEEPNLHSFHCLLDVPDCVASNYEILMDPLPGQTTYRRVLTLDDASKQMVIEMAQEVGVCDTCTGNKATHGFRANMTVTVMDLGNAETGAPPMVAVSDIEPVVFVTDSSSEVNLEVGDRVTVTGFIMDNFCIERGTLLDAPSIVTLREPDRHSVHCLIDVQSCADSNYEVLLDPIPGSEDPMYTRGFVLDDAAKALITDLAKEVGVCTDCDGTGDWEFGFRARVQGTVVALGADGEPPVISVQMATPVPFEGMTGTDATADEPAGPVTTVGADGEVDCSQFQVAYAYPDTALTLEYVLLYDEETNEGNFSARVTYEGQGWVGFAVSPNGAMVGAVAVMGLPDEPISDTNPGYYDLNAQSPAGVVLAPSERQTLLESNIEQNGTHTVLTFTRLLTDEIPIDPTGNNWLLVASGTDNALGFHNARGKAEFPLSPCTAEGGGAAGVIAGGSSDNKENHFRAHGWMACIAWGVLVPIAIANSLCRHLIPVQGLWFELHRAFNSLAIVLTIIAFALVVNALNATQVEPNHFQPLEGRGTIGKHKTIGLVVFILAIIQAVGGVMRPHLPESEGEAKSGVRVMWEFIHKGSGYAILAMAWYQCHSGLKLYAQNFQADDFTDVFWGVTGAIAAIGAVGGLTRLVMPEEPKPQAVPTDDNNDEVVEKVQT